MAADYIPRADGAFDAWQHNFVAYASANAAAYCPSRCHGVLPRRAGAVLPT